MSEPIYIAQTGEAYTQEAQREWLRARAEEGRARGCHEFRASINERPFLLLIEGWERLPKDQGEPRFSLTWAAR
ncbi:MAG: hypothetical protein E5X05_01225 [Mesorhizobium sp.]|nr:MAG: hypothetical protein E5X05_01225 [Mesorhizobium sp.]